MAESTGRDDLSRPLAGVAVLELGAGVACGYAAKLLADLGADVSRLPFGAMDPHRDASQDVRAWLDSRKRAVPDAVDGASLLSSTDIVLTDARPEALATRLGVASIRDAHPRLVCVHVTPFGITGPYSSFRGGDLEVAFLSGLAYLTPRDIPRPADAPLPPPLKMPACLVSIYSGASAAAAALCALHARDRDGTGSVVDVSMLDSVVPTLRREIALAEIEDRVASRFMRVWRLAPYGVKRCRDGYVFLQVVEKYHWEGLLDMMGHPEWARDPRYLDAETRFAHREAIEARLAPWLLTQDKSDFAWEAQRRGVPFAPINEPLDVLRIPQLHYRGFFGVASGDDGRARMIPGMPFAFARAPGTAAATATTRREPASAQQARPLAGLRVVDFGHVWAGPYCTALLADMGAEVIKVESAHRLDIHRRQGPYAGGMPASDRSGVWNAQNRGKRSVALNLSTDAGRALARRLVARADVVVENFAPGVMTRLGLDYGSLCEHKPDLVMASLSAFGQDGPQRALVGYGPSLDAWASLDWLTAYPGGSPNALGGMFPDTGSAIHAAAAILAALHERDRTGTGRYIDVSELEVSATLVGDVLARALGGERIAPHGNGDPFHFPHGCYACAGDDDWIALSVPDAEAWRGLATVIGRPDWADDPRLTTSASRRERRAEIDAAIAAWAGTRSSEDAMRTLQAQGVPAAMAHTPQTLLDDPHLVARGYFEKVEHPQAGVQTLYGRIWRLSFDHGARIAKPAPVLGADSEQVLRGIVGLDASEYQALVEARVVY